MLAYLDAMIAAIAVRDHVEVAHLLAHPLARILSAAARAEVDAFRDGTRDPRAAPLLVMQLRHQTAELLRDVPVVADRAEVAEVAVGPRRPRAQSPEIGRRAGRLVQMELPLSA